MTNAISRYSLIQKIGLLSCQLSLIINNFLPIVYLSPSLTYAQETTPSQEVKVTIAPTLEQENTPVLVEPTVEPTNVPTIEPTVEPTVEPSIDPTITPVIEPTSIATPEATPILTVTLSPENTSEPNASSTSIIPQISPTLIPTITIVPTQVPIDGHVKTTVVESYSCRADSLNGCLISDKPDYSPTDVALITGYGFMPDTEYLLRITSSDEPAVLYEKIIRSDEQGSFSYSYQLDGNYRPNYSVNLTDLSGVILASTTFTDSRSVNSATLNGSSTVSVLANATISAAVTVNHTGSDNNWRSTGWRIGTSGSFTCVNHNDHNSDGTQTETFNVTAPSSTGVYTIQFVAYSNNTCNSGASSTFGLVNSITVYTPPKLKVVKIVQNGTSGATTIASAFQMKVDGNNVSQNISNTQTLGSHTITETGPAGYTATYSASCPGGVVNLGAGDDKTCTVTNTAIAPKLTITKIVSGGSAQVSDFTLKANQTTLSSGVKTSLSIGTYTISETPSSNGSGYTGTILCNGQATNSITLALGDDKSCTITNTRDTGALRVHKQVDNDGNGSFEITSDSSANNLGFRWGIVSTPSNNTTNFGSSVTLNTGTTTVYENSVSGYHFVGWFTSNNNEDDEDQIYSCTNPQGTTLPISVSITKGNTTQITLCNARDNGKIKIVKNTIGGNGTFNFTTAGLSNFSLTTSNNSSDITFSDLLISGSYSVSETVQTDWDLTSSSCDHGTPSSITVLAGQITTCTFTNTKKATLTLVKNVNNNFGGSALNTSWTLSAIGPTSISGVSGNSSITNAQVKSGTYTLTESEGPTGYNANSWSCTNAVTVTNGQITLTPGQNTICTITNDDIQPKLTITKVVINDNGGTKKVSNFPLFINDTQITSGAQNLLNVGSYTISETADSGYTSSITGDCTPNGSVTLVSGDVKSCTITNNDKPATLIVKKVILDNQRGTKSYSDFSFQVNDTETTAFEEDGQNDLTIDAGVYTVTEPAVSGYTTTYSNCSDLQLDNGGTATCIITNTKNGQLTVTKFHDYNANGNKDEQDSLLGNWEILATPATGSAYSQITNANSEDLTYGQAIFDLPAGDYQLSETQKDGWFQSNIYCSNEETKFSKSNNTSNLDFSLTPGENKTCFIGNYQRATITINKNVVDFNGKDISDSNPFSVSGGESLGQKSFSEESPATFTVSPGSYSFTEVEINDKYQLKNITDCKGDVLESGEITAISGRKYCLSFTNQKVKPVITIAKYNSTWPGNTSNGSQVEYTITLKIKDNDVKGMLVTDLPPKGFIYKHGSYKVKVNNIPVSIAEPQYHSPGKWFVGDLSANDVVTLTYLADVDNTVDPGLYKDIAWAFGCSDSIECTASSDDKLLALSTDSGKLDTGVLANTFVGTKVRLDKNFTNSSEVNVEQEVKGEVLGASTSLPQTGSNTIWLLISTLLSIFGLSFMIYSRKSNKKMPILITLFFALALILPKSSLAAQSENIFTRIEDPKSPTNQSKFTLDFVAVDMLGRALSVTCYKKNPDNTVVQLGSPISVIPGGNSGQCSLDSDPLTENTKTYSFYVIAASGSETYQSETVSVDFNTNNPMAPNDYSREWVSSCQNKIKFKAANDGRTTKIEIYRSESTTFTADGNTKVGEVGISPDQVGSFTDIVPDCNKTYYYAIRAFDGIGNGSGVVGDQKTVVTSTTTTTTQTGQGAIPVSGGAGIPEEETPAITATPESGTGSVLGQGESTESSSQTGAQKVSNFFVSSKWGIFGLGLLILLISIYAQKKNSKKKNK